MMVHINHEPSPAERWDCQRCGRACWHEGLDDAPERHGWDTLCLGCAAALDDADDDHTTTCPHCGAPAVEEREHGQGCPRRIER